MSLGPPPLASVSYPILSPCRHDGQNLVRAELSLSQDITQGAESCSREVIESKTQLSQAIEALRSDVLQEVTRIAAQSQLIRSEIAFIQGRQGSVHTGTSAAQNDTSDDSLLTSPSPLCSLCDDVNCFS